MAVELAPELDSRNVDPEEAIDLLCGISARAPTDCPSARRLAAAVVYLPPLQRVFGTAPLGLPELAVLSVFPVVVSGSDELRRCWRRRPR
jgi:hypothetical protein